MIKEGGQFFFSLADEVLCVVCCCVYGGIDFFGVWGLEKSVSFEIGVYR